VVVVPRRFDKASAVAALRHCGTVSAAVVLRRSP
jgi:hypothetical protein